jgi:Arc/MetJ family transcription regulator
MRTTLDIDDDVLAAAKELSRQQGRSVGAVVSSLMRQALTGSASASDGRPRQPQRQVAGFRPFAARGKAVTNDAIHAIRDEEGV